MSGHKIFESVKAMFIDLIDVFLDWPHAISEALRPVIPDDNDRHRLLDQWQQSFSLEYINAKSAGMKDDEWEGQRHERYSRLLHNLLEQRGVDMSLRSSIEHKDRAVETLYRLPAYDDAKDFNRAVKARGNEIDVIGLGDETWRRMYDCVRMADLECFDAIWSKQNLDSDRIYGHALERVVLMPHEVMVVSCRDQDLRIAKDAEMRTVFVCRSLTPHQSHDDPNMGEIKLAASRADFVVCNQLVHPGHGEARGLDAILDELV
ncbi:hypothetical protein B0T21DRAFT_411800 [Apiosordaria backusii]|uniref:Uncharacterized protein n=1 Tax=Apiosordaria backusii TaxID=314023 RepID=A0AA40BM24_9PEZI|nr:hypothetical protein B0T21DRAFT_411800 [Apiosordaria backusii]